jgi:hypothetical protein
MALRIVSPLSHRPTLNMMQSQISLPRNGNLVTQSPVIFLSIFIFGATVHYSAKLKTTAAAKKLTMIIASSFTALLHNK